MLERMIAFPADMLGLLGPQFVPAAATLRILCVGLLIGQGAGPIMTLLVMSGRSRQSVYFLASAATIYTLIALQAVPRFGTVGGALSGLATILLVAPVVTTYTQRALKIRLYGRRMLKPIGAILVALAAGFVVSLVLPSVAADQGRHVLRIGRAVSIAATVVGVYVGVLLKLGVEPEERAVLANASGPLSKLRKKLAKLVK